MEPCNLASHRAMNEVCSIQTFLNVEGLIGYFTTLWV